MEALPNESVPRHPSDADAATRASAAPHGFTGYPRSIYSFILAFLQSPLTSVAKLQDALAPALAPFGWQSVCRTSQNAEVTMGNESTQTMQRLHFRVAMNAGLFSARCPELDVYATAESFAEAKRALFDCAKVTSRFLVSQNGAADADPRRPFAELVVQHWTHLDELFVEV